MKHAIENMTGMDSDAPMRFGRLALIYLSVWVGCGLFALTLHLVCAPDYIDVPTRIVGGAANLLGPWARPVAGGWPNAGKPPHAPSAFMGLIVLVLMAGVVVASLTLTDRWAQYFCIAAFIFLMAVWIGIGFLELMICAA
jgi:hypothetical protein